CVVFFSSRRRHTRSKRDWSSDVCSSDLCCARGAGHRTGAPPLVPAAPGGRAPGASRGVLAGTAATALDGDDATGLEDLAAPDAPGLTALEGTLPARLQQRAGAAQGLGLFEIGGPLGEEEVGGVDVMARQLVARRSGRGQESGE